MNDLHEQLRRLVAEHGTGILATAEQFRAALDDYLTEQDASQGELNLLVDAVRLGGVDRLTSMLDNGADPIAAVHEAGDELARDRSSDAQRARWAVAAVGYALGRVGGETVRRQLGGEATRIAAHPPTAPAAPAPPVQSPPHQPVQSPPHQPSQSPAQGWPAPAQGYPQQAYAGPPPARKNRTGLFVGLGALAVLVVAAVVLVVLAPWDDDDGGGGTGGGGGGEETTAAACDKGCVEGDGYQYELPDGWQDITDQVKEDNPGQPTLDTASAWGESVAAGRANVIVEVSSWTYSDIEDARDVLSGNLSSLGGEVEDIEGRTIDGEEAEGVLLTRENESGVEVEQRAYIVRHGEDAVVITATNRSGDDKPLDRYEEIYDSWSWG